MKKLFTLIELIVVIVVIGILATIVIPNINNVKTDATRTAISSNLQNIQTSVDMYGLDNHGSVPTEIKPTKLNPQPINFNQLYPEYVRNTPNIVGVNYWVDLNSKVWSSTIDSPTNVLKVDNLLEWNLVEKSTHYNIYEVISKGKTSSNSYKSTILYQFVESTVEKRITVDKDKEYVVSAVDSQGFETAPVGEGYIGYQNQKPIAVIDFSPKDNITTNTTISWNTTQSVDFDGDAISKFEWKGKQDVYPTAGTYTVELRVQDSRGMWSEWKSADIQVVSASFTPTKVSVSKTLTTTDVQNDIDIEVDSKGNIYYFWVQSSRIYYKVLDLNGTVIKPKKILSPTNIDLLAWDASLKSFDAVLDSNDNIYLNYQKNGETFISKFDSNGTTLISEKQIFSKSQFIYGGRYNVSFTIFNDTIYMTARDYGFEGGSGNKVYIYKLDLSLNQIGNRILFAYIESFYESQIKVTSSRIYVLYSGWASTSSHFSTTLVSFDHEGKNLKTSSGRTSGTSSRRYVGDFEFDTNNNIWIFDNNAWNQNYDIRAYKLNSTETGISSNMMVHSGLMDGYVRSVLLPDGRILFTYKESGYIKYKTLEK